MVARGTNPWATVVRLPWAYGLRLENDVVMRREGAPPARAGLPRVPLYHAVGHLSSLDRAAVVWYHRVPCAGAY